MSSEPDSSEPRVLTSEESLVYWDLREDVREGIVVDEDRIAVIGRRGGMDRDGSLRVARELQALRLIRFEDGRFIPEDVLWIA